MIFLETKIWVPILLLSLLLFLFFLRIFKRQQHLQNMLKNKRRVLSVVLVLAFFALGFTLLQPSWGVSNQKVSTRGLDILVMMDLSDSMQVKDIKPNRFKIQKRKVLDLLDMIQGDRVALLNFSGVSYLKSPFTHDYNILKSIVKDINAKDVPVQGTELAPALEHAVEVFRESKSNKAILLFTDGEDHSREMDRVIQELVKNKVHLFIVGVGTPEGAALPSRGRSTRKNPDGTAIITRLNEKHLSDLAKKTRGAYVRAQIKNDDLELIYHQGIRKKMQLSDFEREENKNKIHRYRYFLFPAFLLLALERLLVIFWRKS